MLTSFVVKDRVRFRAALPTLDKSGIRPRNLSINRPVSAFRDQHRFKILTGEFHLPRGRVKRVCHPNLELLQKIVLSVIRLDRVKTRLDTVQHRSR